jgi:hypothetical protein
MGWVAKSYMKKGFLLYEEMSKYLVIYEEGCRIYDFQVLLSEFPKISVHDN